MNKRLFCALCCVGVAGYSSEVGTVEDLCGELIRSVDWIASDGKIIEKFEAVSRSLEELCRYFEPCLQAKEALVSSFQKLVPLYEQRIEQKLCDQTSEKGQAVLRQLDGDINALEQNVRDQLVSYAKETQLTNALHPELYRICCDHLKRAMKLFCHDEAKGQNS